MQTTFRHCDDFIEDETQPECLRKFLEHCRAPAHGSLLGTPRPALFATLTKERRGIEYLGSWDAHGPKCREFVMPEGMRVRVTFASRMGDVGISTNMSRETGYDARVSLEILTDFASQISGERGS